MLKDAVVIHPATKLAISANILQTPYI